MTKNQEDILRDLQGFIQFCIDNNRDFWYVLGNLNHDIVGLNEGQDCFSPRTYGYAKYLESTGYKKEENNDNNN